MNDERTDYRHTHTHTHKHYTYHYTNNIGYIILVLKYSIPQRPRGMHMII